MNQKSSNNKRKSKSRYNSRARKDFRDEAKVEKKECPNDPSWYIRENQIAKDVASLSFNNALGAPVVLHHNNSSDDFKDQPLVVPGIMAIHTVPAPGISRSAVSPINIAAKNLYSFVRHANSGHTNYDSPDLIMYVLAMDSVFSWIYHLQRIYGVAQIFSQKNRYIGDALIQAMGFQPTSVRSNLSMFRSVINMLILKASVFAVPNTMTLFKRHAWMYSSIFSDSPVEKCQMYMYLPSVLHKYVETDGVGRLQATEMLVRGVLGSMTEVAPMTITQAVTKGEELLGVLQASEDINIMSGDILKAYGRENLFQLGLIPETYAVLPIYSEEILDQIHNTVFMGGHPRVNTGIELPTTAQLTTYSIDSFNVYQDPSIGAGNLLYQPACVDNAQFGYDNILDMADNEPTPERVLVATRNMVTGETRKFSSEGTDYYYSTVTSAGSDICTYATVYYNDPTTGVLTSAPAFKESSQSTGTIIFRLDKFHKAPLYYHGSVHTDGKFGLNVPCGSIEDFTIVTEDVLSKIHQSAVLSMLGVPV